MKKTLMLLLAALLILSLAACSPEQSAPSGDTPPSGSTPPVDPDMDSYEAGGVKLTDETTYYNTWLGLSLTFPKDWFFYEITPENFPTEEGSAADPSTFDIAMGDDFEMIWMGDFANLQDSRKSNHMGYTVYAERIDGVATLADYVETYIAYQESEYGLVFVEEDSVEISGQFFETNVFEEENEGTPYYYLNFICEVTDGYFLVIETSYWPENTGGPDTITEFLRNNLTVQTPDRPVV